MMAMLLPAGEGGRGVPDLLWLCFQSEQVGAVASPEDWEKVWDNWRPLTMAGIFDCWEPPAGGDCLYSYSIITVDSCKVLNDIHNRQARPPRLRSEGSGQGLSSLGLNKQLPEFRVSACTDLETRKQSLIHKIQVQSAWL